MMLDNKIDNLINEKKIPEQLKEYFLNSKRGKNFINEQMLEAIEELYIYYSALYLFDETEFSAFTITTLERGSEHSAYYYYLKKILDNQMELLPKMNGKNYINGNIVDFKRLYKFINNEFNNQIQYFSEEQYDEVEMHKIYVLWGQLNLISQLAKDDNIVELFETSSLKLENIIKNYNIEWSVGKD